MNNKELTELERIAEIHNYDTELDELLDCPFCGGRPVAFLRGNEHLNKSGKKVSVTIRCPNCRIERTDAVLKNSIEWLEEVAIKNWNNRSSVPSHDEIKREALKVTGETSDGYHTFNELYAFRKVFNAGLFNEWSEKGQYKVHKSKKHSDGEECFGGGWFIVTATLPTGQISNHYELGDWDLFQCEEREKADVWDGHTPQDVLTRLTAYLTQKENNE